MSDSQLENLAEQLIAAKRADPRAKISALAKTVGLTPKAAGRILRAAGLVAVKAPTATGLQRIVAIVARESSRPQREVRFLLELALTVIRDELHTRGEVRIRDFGRFRWRRSPPRTVATPGHPEQTHQVVEHETVAFRASPNWRRR